MILFIIILIGCLIYTTFGKDWLVESIRTMKERNAAIEYKIEHGYFNTDCLSMRQYNKSDLDSIPKLIGFWVIWNFILMIINVIVVLIVSGIVIWVCPRVKTQYSFNINSLKDNLVTSGEIHGSAFCISGSFDGEISYFFSRTMSNGEKIGHIPADKTYIKYDDENPHIEVHQTTNKFPKWLGEVLWLEDCNTIDTEYYVIVVPEGTITTTGTYQIDME